METIERAEDLTERLPPARTPKRRMLVIVNPYATTVSDRLRNLVVYALESRYSVEAIDTQERNHATRLCREAAREATTSWWRSAATEPSTKRPTGWPARTPR